MYLNNPNPPPEKEMKSKKTNSSIEYHFSWYKLIEFMSLFSASNKILQVNAIFNEFNSHKYKSIEAGNSDFLITSPQKNVTHNSKGDFKVFEFESAGKSITSV